jgi:hypothetical protein
MNKHDDLTSKQKTLTIAINLTLVSMAFFFSSSHRDIRTEEMEASIFFNGWLKEKERDMTNPRTLRPKAEKEKTNCIDCKTQKNPL